jgi:fumarate hydratase class I
MNTKDLSAPLLELIRLTTTDLPAVVENRLRAAMEQEEDHSAAKKTLETILENIHLARAGSLPLCQDSGTPHFFVQRPTDWSERELTRQIRQAVAEATRRGWLRPNAVDALTGRTVETTSGMNPSRPSIFRRVT